MTSETRRRRLSAGDWVAAALAAIAAGGIDAVAVEPLAAKLGTTKGSFYWHFANRGALVDAALEAWEAQHTEAVIAAMERIDRPAQRLDELMSLVLAEPADRLDIGLLASVRDPAVGPVYARVTQRRIDYVAALYRATGLDEATAYSAAVTAVSVYLGHVQLANAAPATLPVGDAWAAHLDHVRQALTPKNAHLPPI